MVGLLTLDFGSGHDLTVDEFELHVRFCPGSVEPAWDILSLPLPNSCSLSLSLSHTINKLKTNLLKTPKIITKITK